MNLDLCTYIPTTVKEASLRGWTYVDVVIFSGDAYVDHPQFGAAVIARVLENAGYHVVIVPQPDWHGDHRDFTKFGEPRLFFAITSGAMDSMVNHYTANKRRRSDDAFSSDGQAKLRPDYCVNTYCSILRQYYPQTPIVIGGIEASMRRLTHYDYWSDSVLPSILVTSKADILVYGMAEKAILSLAQKGIRNDIPQTAWLCKNYENKLDTSHCEILHSFEQVSHDKSLYGENFCKIDTASNQMSPKTLVEPIGGDAVVVNPPFPTMTTQELDAIYDLPFCYQPHPKYRNKRLPAFEMIQFSVCLHRGCFGGCSFCAISAHQGKFITSRSKESILKQVHKLAQLPDWKGYISDLGGPSANMYGMHGKDMTICQQCRRYSCIHPNQCPNLLQNYDNLIDIYQTIDNQPFIKKSFVASGVRYDIINERYAEELIRHHVGGRLKVAPEHTQPDVLRLMHKPSFDIFLNFQKMFDELNKKYGLSQQLIPYFISSHPGCTMHHMQALVQWTHKAHLKPEQVQDFTPTPMTLSTTMFYTKTNPYTHEKVYVATTPQQKKLQNSTFFWWKKSEKA